MKDVKSNKHRSENLLPIRILSSGQRVFYGRLEVIEWSRSAFLTLLVAMEMVELTGRQIILSTGTSLSFYRLEPSTHAVCQLLEAYEQEDRLLLTRLAAEDIEASRDSFRREKTSAIYKDMQIEMCMDLL